MANGLSFSSTSHHADDGLDFGGYLQPPDVPPDPLGDDWRGPPGLAASNVPAEAYVNPVPPVSPGPGALWFNPIDTQLYVWYPDPNSAQWVIANNTASMSGATPGGPFFPLYGGVPITATRVNISDIPLANPDGSPPAGLVKGDLYNNGGFVCIKP